METLFGPLLAIIRFMKIGNRLVLSLAVMLISITTLAAAAPEAQSRRQMALTDWKFLRGDPSGAEQPAFDDRGWRLVRLPHDWSIEDLPPRVSDPLFHVETLVPGSWRFRFGDDEKWKAPGLDDSSWQEVRPPESWSGYQGATKESQTGWYRRSFTIPEAAAGKTVLIELGRINDLDEGYVDGILVHKLWIDDIYWSNGRVGPRTYLLPAELAKPGRHVVAVRVRGKTDGGIVAGPPQPPAVSPCDPGRSAEGLSTGYAVGGTGWYRSRFTLPTGDQDKAVGIVFDGSYMETSVWLNGTRVGKNVYGYSPFGFDLTPYLKPAGQENLVAVRVENRGKNSRWYSGSGLYRPVCLQITSPTRIARWGIAITTPEVTDETAAVRVQVELQAPKAAAETRIKIRVVDPNGNPAGSAEAPVVNGTENTRVDLRLTKPRRWSPDTPVLYRAEVALLVGGRVTDLESILFGIRTIAWNTEQGLVLNGRPVELRGGCVHHDHGPLGAASFPAAEERRVAKLRAAGYNAIRCAHNPPASSFLDACDRLGMLVIDEAFDMWNKEKNSEDYHRFFKEWWQRDLDAMVRRDRNHPSVIIWSIGNEIGEEKEPLGAETARALAGRIRAIDPTRPITAAFGGDKTKGDAFFAALDIAGYNYALKQEEADRTRRPDRLIVGTESYARESFGYWELIPRLASVVGDFIWTAWDYRGESGIGHTVQSENNSYLMPWPWHNAFCGDFDVCGFEKPQSLYRQVLWGMRPLAILVERPGVDGTLSKADLWGWRDEQPSWTWPGAEGQELVVRVYGAGDEVSLALDDNQIAQKPVGNEQTTEFRVPYRPGRLTARLVKAGKEAAKASLTTGGQLAGLRLSAERLSIPAAADALAYVVVEAVDRAGNLVPVQSAEASVQVSGPGQLIAFGNGDPTDVGSVQDSRQKLWHGRALAIIRSTGQPGTIGLTVTVAGLSVAKVSVTVR